MRCRRSATARERASTPDSIATVRALLVDYGGVLTTSVLDSFATFCAEEDIDPTLFRDAVLQAARTPDSPFTRVETGAITRQRFDEEVAELLSAACGKQVAATNLKQRLFAAVRPDEGMRDAVRAARASGILTAMVSNSWGGDDYPLHELEGLFDVHVISGEIGLRKPEPDIYLHAARALDVAPDSCVFVDDFRINVDGARAVGMTGVLHRASADTIAELERLFGVSLRR